MKKILSVSFAFAMLLSVAFIGEVTSSNSPFSAQAQTQTRRGSVTVTRKRRGGVVGGAKYVYRKAKNGTVYVYRKTAQGTVYVGKKTYQGGKYVGTKTVQGTRYTTHKTKRGAKATVSRTKKIILGN